MRKAAPLLLLAIPALLALTIPGGTMRGMQTGPVAVGVAAIPATAAIVYPFGGEIWVMDADGGNDVQITSYPIAGTRQHVAVSRDRTKIAATWSDTVAPFHSHLEVWDLTAQSRTDVLADWAFVGNGGVAWDAADNLYFAGVQTFPFDESTVVQAEILANVRAHDVYRVHYDGTNPMNLTAAVSEDNYSEVDASISDDGATLVYAATDTTPGSEASQIRAIASAGGGASALVRTGGGTFVVHDPEISPDGTQVVYSQEAAGAPNWGNAVQYLYSIPIGGGTPSGPYGTAGATSVLPDWAGDKWLYWKVYNYVGTDDPGPPGTDPEDRFGLVVSNSDGSSESAVLKVGSALGRWIPAVCGNSAVSFPETCDDGNTTSGDGCSATCQIEGL